MLLLKKLNNMHITKEQIISYKEDGYLILRDVINTDYIDELMNFVTHVIRLEIGEDTSSFSNKEILNEQLIKLKKAYPLSSSWIYQTILNSNKLRRFFSNIQIENLVMTLLNMEDDNNLGVVSPAFRFDIPGDTRNIRTWHQDGNYFLENSKGEDHLVVWIPMNKSTKDNGSVLIAPKTHKLGKQDSVYQKSEGLNSEQYTSPEEQYKDIEHICIEAKKGDIAFINMDLIHSSGTNITANEVRYTAQIRYNTINRDDYRPVQLLPKYLNYNRK